MMQFTENPPVPPPPFQQLIFHDPLSSSSNTIMDTTSKSQNHRARPWPWPGFPTTTTTSSSSSSSKSSSLPLGISSSNIGDASCMEQLLVHCANAIENNDATLAQQILWVLNNIATPDGDSNQRLACAFLRALVVRAANNGTCKMMLSSTTASASAMASAPLAGMTTHRYSVLELANYVDLTPWHRFGFTAANAAIVDVIDGYSVVHIVDFSLTHCMQIPTLIEAIADRQRQQLERGGSVPSLHVKLTVAGLTEDIPPLLEENFFSSYDELGSKLVSFARSRNVTLEFKVIPTSPSDGFSSIIQHLQQSTTLEALIINCQMMLRYIHPDDTNHDHHRSLIPISSSTSPPIYNDYSSLLQTCSPSVVPLTSTITTTSSGTRSMFLKTVRSLNPTLVLLVDEDVDFTSNNLVCRLRSAFNYMWIPYDTVDTFLTKGSKQRKWYEAEICWKIENLLAHEGLQRVERQENKSQWVQRMKNAGFQSIGFGDDAVSEVKNLLEEHAAGWGSKKDDDHHLVLTWKGHNVVFANAWVPSPS
nr:SCL32 [Tamarix hispida]